MADLSIYKVDLDTPQPGGRQGESPRAAFTKYNDMLDEIRGLLDVIDDSPPLDPVPYMVWLDTTDDTLYRRNAANTDWTSLGNAFQFIGTAAGLSAANVVSDFASSAEPDPGWPFMTWLDTSTTPPMLKRRNVANTAWLDEGVAGVPRLPIFPANAIPTVDLGPIYVIGLGAHSWAGSAYAPDGTFGPGQTLQNVTASRAFDTVYTNTTGRPIFVLCRAITTVSMDMIIGRINDIQIVYSMNPRTGTPTSSTNISVSFMVPVGATYQVDNTSGSATLVTWQEIR